MINIENNKLKLTIPIPPSINNDYMKPRGILKYKDKKSIAMAMLYETSEAKKFKKDMVKLIKEEIKKQGWKLDFKPDFFYVSWTFFFPRINMDTNNYFKCPVDAITDTKGLIWDDDNISMMKDSRIYYDSKNPRVELEIYPAPFIGVFDNKEDFDKFLDEFCNKCNKGKKIGQKGGCSIYKKALESRIQEDLNINFDTGEKSCLKFKPIK